MLRGNIVKDDSGAHAAFTEQDSSASQMTAAKVMDVISRLSDCDGQAADATSAKTQVKIEDAPKMLKNPKSECSDVWIRFPRHKWPKSWCSMEDPVVPLERNLHGHQHAGLLWKRQFEEVLLELGWEKVSNWECLFVHRRQKLFLSVNVDAIKMAGKNQNVGSYVEEIDENVDVDKPTSFLDHAHSGCTRRECKPNDAIVQGYKKMFESRISAGATEKLPGWERPHAKTSACSYDMEGHAQKMRGNILRTGK